MTKPDNREKEFWATSLVSKCLEGSRDFQYSRRDINRENPLIRSRPRWVARICGDAGIARRQIELTSEREAIKPQQHGALVQLAGAQAENLRGEDERPPPHEFRGDDTTSDR